VAHYLGDSDARVIFAWGGTTATTRKGAEVARADLVEVEPTGFAAQVATWPAERKVSDRSHDVTAVILYTSGTTGTPRMTS